MLACFSALGPKNLRTCCSQTSLSPSPSLGSSFLLYRIEPCLKQQRSAPKLTGATAVHPSGDSIRCCSTCSRHRHLPSTGSSTSSRDHHPYHALPSPSLNTGNLYLFRGSRPPARGFPQIPYRRLSWFHNDHAAGRGANQRLIDLEFARSPTGRLRENLLDSYFLEDISRLQSPSVPRTARNTIPARLRNTPGPFAVPPAPAVTKPAADANLPSELSEPQGEPGEKGGHEGGSHGLEKHEDAERIRSKIALWDSEERRANAPPPVLTGVQPLKPSDQIYVLGLDLAGRYITHSLAGCQTIPPVRYLLHTRGLCRKWIQANGQLTVYRGHNFSVRSRVEAEDISGFPEESVDEEDMIHNLIITIPAGQVVQALERIKHRLDQRSTICLVNDGLGVAEALIEAYFPIESRRPVFLLGHFSAYLGPAEEAFSVSEVRQGRLYLSIFSPQAPGPAMPFRIKRHPPPERTVRATHLIRLLTAIPGLHASGYPMTSFFRYKLPMMAFRSIVDPVSVLLDCTYDKLLTNRYARQLMDRLLGELTGVVAALPELRDSEEFRQSAIDASLRKDVFKKLLAHRTANTRMRTQISRGWDTDIDFLSGYFVRRGRQVRANVTALDSIMGAVKAKNRTVTDQMEEELPMEVGPP